MSRLAWPVRFGIPNDSERLAERRGFEPPDRFYPINRLAGGCLQPTRPPLQNCLAEGVGFEPTELSLSGFQDRRLKPLGHPSTPCGTRRYAFCLFPDVTTSGTPAPTLAASDRAWVSASHLIP